MFNPEIWKKITPIWFTWLSWFIALGAIGFIAKKTNNLGLNIIFGISYVCFFMFITTSISDIMKYKIIKNEKTNKLFTLMIAIAILALSTIVLHQAIEGLSNG